MIASIEWDGICALDSSSSRSHFSGYIGVARAEACLSSVTRISVSKLVPKLERTVLSLGDGEIVVAEAACWFSILRQLRWQESGVVHWHQPSSTRWFAIQGRRLLIASVDKGVAAVVQEGQTFEIERAFTKQDVASYVSLCGDTNPIHTCDAAAQSAGFQGRVVQGMLYAGLFPAIIGSHFDGAVYVSQTLDFKAPVLVGDALRAQVEVIAIKKLRRHHRVTFATHCYKKGDSTAVLGGEAVALLPSA